MSILVDNVQAVRGVKSYAVNIAATSTFATQTIGSPIVRLSPLIGCFYKIGTSTDLAATTGLTGVPLLTGVIEYRKCNVGDTIHAITATGGLAAAGLIVEEIAE